MISLKTPQWLTAVDHGTNPSSFQQDHQGNDSIISETKQRAEKKRLREAEWRVRAASGPHPEIGIGMGMQMTMPVVDSSPQPANTADEILRLTISIEKLTTSLKGERELRKGLEEQLDKCQQIQNQTLNALDEKFQHLIEMDQELGEKSTELQDCEIALKTQIENVHCRETETQKLREELKATREDSGFVADQLRKSESDLLKAQNLLAAYETDLALKKRLIEDAKDELKTAAKEKATLQNQLDKSHADCSEIGNTKGAMEAELEKLQNQLREKNIEVKNLYTKLDMVEDHRKRDRDGLEDELEGMVAYVSEIEAEKEGLVTERNRSHYDNQRLEHRIIELQEEAYLSRRNSTHKKSMNQELKTRIQELNELSARLQKKATEDKTILQAQLSHSKANEQQLNDHLLRLSAEMEESSRGLSHQLETKENELRSLRAELEQSTKDHQQEVLHWMGKANQRDEAVIKLLAKRGSRNIESSVEVILIVAEISGAGYSNLVQAYRALVNALRWRNPNARVGLIAIDHLRSKNTAHVRYPELVTEESGDMLQSWLQMPYTWSGLVHDVYDFGTRLLGKVKVKHGESTTSTRIIRIVDPEDPRPDEQLHKDCQKYQMENVNFCLLFTHPLPETWTHQKADWDKVTGGKTYVMPMGWHHSEECAIFEVEELVGRPSQGS